MSAAAPSLSGLELPAVTVPSFVKAGRSFASVSIEESRRGPSSASTTVSPLRPLTVTGTSSSAKRPASCAATAFCVAVQREGVLLLAGDVVLGDDRLGRVVVGRHAEALDGEVLGRLTERVGVAHAPPGAGW